MLQPIRHSTVTSTYRSVDHHAVSGDAAQAVPVADGSINSGQITTFHLQTSGGVLSTVVTERRRYGPVSWLSDNINKTSCIRLLGCLSVALSFCLFVCLSTVFEHASCPAVLVGVR